jgi:hypothetical protein
MLQDSISRGKIPNFVRLHQSSGPLIKDRLTYIHNRFLSTFPTKQSITLNKIFDDLSALQRQLNRLEQKLQVSSTKTLSINTHSHRPLKINQLTFATIPFQETIIIDRNEHKKP